jgi:hypothetical protein
MCWFAGVLSAWSAEAGPHRLLPTLLRILCSPIRERSNSLHVAAQHIVARCENHPIVDATLALLDDGLDGPRFQSVFALDWVLTSLFPLDLDEEPTVSLASDEEVRRLSAKASVLAEVVKREVGLVGRRQGANEVDVDDRRWFLVERLEQPIATRDFGLRVKVVRRVAPARLRRDGESSSTGSGPSVVASSSSLLTAQMERLQSSGEGPTPCSGFSRVQRASGD